MDIKLDLTGMTFEQQKELLLLQKELVQLETKNIERINMSEINKELSKRMIKESEETLDYNMWNDYLEWCKEWKEVLIDDNVRYDYKHGMSPNRYYWIKRYGVDYKDKLELSPRDYYMNEYTTYGGIKIPKNPNKKDEQFDRFANGIERMGMVMLDKAIMDNTTMDFISLHETGFLSSYSNDRYNNYRMK